jgi:hypothetical protein
VVPDEFRPVSRLALDAPQHAVGGSVRCTERKTHVDSAVAVVIGAVISGVVGILVVFYQQGLARRHEIDTARAARLGEFSAAGWAATLAISELARASLAQKADIENTARFQALTDRFNSALAQVQLLDDGDVYETAHRINDCLTALSHEARGVQVDRDSWSSKRVELSRFVAEYQRAARSALGSSALPNGEPWIARANEPGHVGRESSTEPTQ